MVSYSPEGCLINTRENKFYLASQENLNKAFNEKTHLEQRASYCDCNHNLHIDFGFMHGIIPRENCAVGIDNGNVRDIAIIARVNKPVRFVIDDILYNGEKPTAILNRKKVQQDFIDKKLSTFSTGDIIDARVTHLDTFGVFCDIGCGTNALLPIDNISVSRIPHPRVRFDVGEDIKVIIKSFDDSGRVTLSHKELLGTWEENARSYAPGETVSGIVRSVEPYGIFVELTPNLSGLAEYTNGINEGQQASVYIKSIIPEKMKFKLIIVDAFDEAYPKAKPQYYITDGHIDHFRYSPVNCTKNIETTF